MDVHKINPCDFYMEVVSEDSASIFSALECGNSEIDKYFHESAWCDDKNVCYAYRNGQNGDVIGLATLCCSGINIDSHSLVELTGEKDPRDHYYVSDDFLNMLLKEAKRISESYVGATHIILYSVKDAVHFYKRNLFHEFEEYMKPEQYMYLEGCKPMYMAL